MTWYQGLRMDHAQPDQLIANEALYSGVPEVDRLCTNLLSTRCPFPNQCHAVVQKARLRTA